MTPEREDAIKAMVAVQIARQPPRTQQECCLMAASIEVALGIIQPGDRLRDHAEASAEGFFGPAFEGATEYQRQVWINMYERALCSALDDL